MRRVRNWRQGWMFMKGSSRLRTRKKMKIKKTGRKTNRWLAELTIPSWSTRTKRSSYRLKTIMWENKLNSIWYLLNRRSKQRSSKSSCHSPNLDLIRRKEKERKLFIQMRPQFFQWTLPSIKEMWKISSPAFKSPKKKANTSSKNDKVSLIRIM